MKKEFHNSDDEALILTDKGFEYIDKGESTYVCYKYVTSFKYHISSQSMDGVISIYICDSPCIVMHFDELTDFKKVTDILKEKIG